MAGRRSSYVEPTLKLAPDDWQDLANEFILNLRQERRSQKTIDLYRHTIEKKFFAWLANVHDGDLGGVTPQMLTRWQLALEDQGQAPASRMVYLAAVCRFFGYLAEQGYIERTPFEGGKVKRPKLDPKRTDYLEENKIEALIRIAGKTRYLGKRNETLVSFMYHSGLRVSEVAALNLEDVNPSTGQVFVRHGKGNRARVASIGPACAKRLIQYKRWRQSYLNGLKWSRPTDALFIGRAGERITAQSIRLMVKEAAAKAGLKDVTPHAFRHASASRAALTGQDIMTLRANFGWSDTSMMPLHYTAQIQRERALAQAQESQATWAG